MFVTGLEHPLYTNKNPIGTSLSDALGPEAALIRYVQRHSGTEQRAAMSAKDNTPTRPPPPPRPHRAT